MYFISEDKWTNRDGDPGTECPVPDTVDVRKQRHHIVSYLWVISRKLTTYLSVCSEIRLFDYRRRINS